MIIVITGVDGAGKSTVAARLFSEIKKTQKAVIMTLGKPQGAWLERVRLIVRGNADNRAGSKSNRIVRKRDRVIRDGLPAVVLALMRRRLSKRARRLANDGVMVIADRWPTLEHGMMDGPRIEISGTGMKRWILLRLQRFEESVYQDVEAADLAFLLTVDVETALSRNAARIKNGKESSEDIIRRHRKNVNFRPIAYQLEVKSNDGTLEEIISFIRVRITKAQHSQ